jgi:putative copper export protein
LTDIATGALRWFEYIGLLGIIGIFVVRRLAANSPRIAWVRPPMQLALAAAFIGGLGVICAEAIGATGSVSGAVAYLFGGPPGWVRVARVVAEGGALALCMLGRRLVAPPAIFAAAALAFAGHAAAVQPAGGAIFADAIHVLSAGVWAGGIMALATLRPPGGWSGEEGRALLWRFGRVALIAFAITAMTGVLNATSALSVPSDLWTTQYGLVLSVKSAGVLVMLVLSALAWRRGFGLVRFEAVIAILVLAATAVLAASPIPPSSGEGTPVQSSVGGQNSNHP